MPFGNSDISARIRQVRGKLKQSEFADLLDIPRPNLSRYESGRQPPADVLQKIADYGGVTVKWLLTGQEEKKDLDHLIALGEHLCRIPSPEPPVEIQEFLLARVMRAVEEYMSEHKVSYELEHRARVMTAIYNYCARTLQPPSRGLVVLQKLNNYPGVTVEGLLTDKEEKRDLEQSRPPKNFSYIPLTWAAHRDPGVPFD